MKSLKIDLSNVNEDNIIEIFGLYGVYIDMNLKLLGYCFNSQNKDEIFDFAEKIQKKYNFNPIECLVYENDDNSNSHIIIKCK